MLDSKRPSWTTFANSPSFCYLAAVKDRVRERFFLPRINSFGVDMEGVRRGLARVPFAS